MKIVKVVRPDNYACTGEVVEEDNHPFDTSYWKVRVLDSPVLPAPAFWVESKYCQILKEQVDIEGTVQVGRDGESITVWNPEVWIKLRLPQLDLGYFPAARLKIHIELEQIPREELTTPRDRSVVKPALDTTYSDVTTTSDKLKAARDKADSPELWDKQDRKLKQTIHNSALEGIDTHRLSGVGAIGAENIEVVRRFKPGEVFQNPELHPDEAALVEGESVQFQNLTRKSTGIRRHHLGEGFISAPVNEGDE